ncbi:ABC transporter ATP-binding protein [Aureimonas fodinaquatilis]|uniref:Spermidine/putrescine import ATP-binding protein PotA n=1 Tax=Aureimonas fodinaquatilis TaxID=2565783 RepID=A0A5B0DZU7_9HYPH|nr:ABC transporter ATP-binding protein [Aureimonas fodinaquatilis]KAA0972073.1 ABC transporter ATP-binding protein [Aureimonas fodinaquatilis]
MIERSFIHLENVSKSYGPMQVVEGLDLQVKKGEFLSLLGPSGSGKTTILMMLAGFESITSGAMWLDNQKINELPPHKRGMGVVFQNYALFPHMSVAENVAFPLQMRGMGKADIAAKVKTALERVRLSHLGDRKPSQLSGGQQQRVALTRALVFEPKVILMDEPLGALDKQLREEMQLEIRELHRRLGLTIVFVTHDQSEALTMSDRIAIFDKGKIAQIGAPADVYDRPQNRFVSQFIGETNLLEGVAASDGAGNLVISINGEGADPGPVVTTHASEASVRPGKVALSIRPERLVLNRSEPHANRLSAVVQDAVYQGDHIRLHLAAEGLLLVARAERASGSFEPGQAVEVSFDPADCAVFAA